MQKDYSRNLQHQTRSDHKILNLGEDKFHKNELKQPEFITMNAKNHAENETSGTFFIKFC